jgi:hypothetical protein
VLASLDSQPKTAFDVAGSITWNMAADWRTMPLFHRRLAISESLAHLEMMAVNGLLKKISRDGVIYYRQV